jgi:hypothetical protein
VKLSSILPRLLATAALFVSISSCSENLDSSGVCNVLCPPIGGDVQTVTLDGAVVLDTTVQALSGLGTEPSLLLANRGDTLDTRVIIRFDSLPATFVPTGDTAKKITSVDSAYIQLRIDTLSIKGAEPVTIEAYDVDTTANDTSTAAILALFRPDRFISSQTFARGQLTDTLKYYISNDTLLAKIQNRQPLRIGLRATTQLGSSQMRILSSEALAGPILFFRATPDTATKPLVVTPFSKTPVGDPFLSAVLVDYTVIAKAPPPPPLTVLAVGGLPPRRVYVRFDIPSNIIDSSTVVRATLLLNQIPNTAIDPNDEVRVLPQLVLAGKVVTDPTKAAQIIFGVSSDTLKLKPGDSGEKNVELARAFVAWHLQSPDSLPRAIVLQSLSEGNSPLEIWFRSSEDGTAALRPRLRISYTSRVPLGLP